MGEDFLVTSLFADLVGAEYADHQSKIFRVCQRLREAEIKDADRAGERLLVFANRHHLDRYDWDCSFEIRGEESGERYVDFMHFRSCSPTGSLSIDFQEKLELYATVNLYAALNGAERFSDEEKAALTEACIIATGDPHLLPAVCGYCQDKYFLFYKDAREHAKRCPLHPPRD